MSDSVSAGMVDVCREIEERYDLWSLEIGLDGNHVHFLVQSVPVLSPSRLVQEVKSITARGLFRLHPEIREILWGVSCGPMATISIQLVNMAMRR